MGHVSPTAVQRSLFGTAPMPVIAPVPPTATTPTLTRGIILDRPAARPSSRSWLSSVLGQNRRREPGARLVQGEFRLRDVRPVRNELREDDIAVFERRTSRVIWETPVAERPRDDQDLAWNRLRERRREHALIHSDTEP